MTKRLPPGSYTLRAKNEKLSVDKKIRVTIEPDKVTRSFVRLAD